jgi:hypothetical protein
MLLTCELGRPLDCLVTAIGVGVNSASRMPFPIYPFDHSGALSYSRGRGLVSMAIEVRSKPARVLRLLET